MLAFAAVFPYDSSSSTLFIPYPCHIMGVRSLAGRDDASGERSSVSGESYSLVGRQVSRYRILERIGSGGMGIVYKAEDEGLNRTAAVKFLAPGGHHDDAARSRFLREAQTASALDHPNICTIYEAGETDEGLLYLAMAYYDGRTLSERIAEGPMPVGAAVDTAVQVARGLKKAHDAGIIHRDIKPANVIFTDDGVSKILDFGLAKVADLQLTRTGDTLGTIAYMSPEQIKGGDVDARTDIWALGVVLFEMLAGVRPFKGEYEAAILYSILNAPPEPLDAHRGDVPQDVERTLQRALSKDLSVRYQAMDEMLDDLLKCRTSLRRLSSGAEVEMASATVPTHDTVEAPEPVSAGWSAVGRSLSAAERRHVTMLFINFVPLGGDTDPELLLEAMPAFEDACRKIAQRFEGVHVPYPGEGVLICFGYPQAHEDDARRAVRAGLAAIEACNRLASDGGVHATARAVAHTGLVVAEESRSPSSSMKLVGKTVDQAARLTTMAEPGTLVASATTFRLIEGYFDGREHGTHAPEVGALYVIAHESAARNRIEAAAGEPTPLVGREPEIAMVLGAWEQATEGNGRVVLLRGEAGIGKSRLLQAVKEKVADDPSVWLIESQCSPYHQNSPFYPIIDALERVVLEFSPADGPKEKLDKVEGFLVQYGLDVAETAPLFADLLSLPKEDRYESTSLSPDRQKEKTLEALASVVIRRATEQPFVFVVEDIHWSDPSTRDLLELIIDQCPTVRILVVLTHRPDFKSPWASRSYMTDIALNRLPRKQVIEMVRSLADGKDLPPQLVERIVEKTDGVPLYVEEITRTLLESGRLHERDGRYELIGSIVDLSVPSTLQESLTARLDRLGSARVTAQLGAVVGREFSYELLRVLSSEDENELRAALDVLVDAEIVYQRGLPPASTYVFRHALIQDAAYASLLRSTRRSYHEQIGNVLTAHFPDVAESRPELIAHHYTEAGRMAEAIDWWMNAGRRAAHRSSNAEAVAHLTRALELLETQPDSTDRTHRELALQVMLGPALMAVRGYASDAVERAYRRARELCRQIDDTPEIVAVLFGLWAYYVVSGHLGTARELAEQILRLTEQIPDKGVRLEAHVGLGVTLYFLGEFAEAREHLERAVALFDPDEHASHAASFGQDPGMASRIYLAKTLWMLGRPDLASTYRREAIEIAERVQHSHTSAFCLAYAALLAHFERDAEMALTFSEKTISLAEKHGFPIWGALATVLRGWALAEQGEVETGLRDIDEGIKAWKATGSGLYMPYWLALRSVVLQNMGRLQDAKVTLDKAVSMEESGEERVVLAELYRLSGSIRASDDPTGALGLLEQSLRTASEQSARSWQLRTEMELARLRWSDEKAADETTLAGLLSHFPEGLESRDLKEAHQLLGNRSEP